jgi:hypothetical protein
MQLELDISPRFEQRTAGSPLSTRQAYYTRHYAIYFLIVRKGPGGERILHKRS